MLHRLRVALAAMLLAQLVLPAFGWMLPTPISTASILQPALSKVSRPSRPSSVQQLRASSSLAADPNSAWAQHGSGDSSLLSSIASSVDVLKPASGEVINVKEFVGQGKGLVVFMRHIG